MENQQEEGDLVCMKYDLEDRLISFAPDVIDLIESLPLNRACNHLAGQLIRSGTSPALSYGEAQAGESKKDFIHKMGVALKELRETRINLKIIQKKRYAPEKELNTALKESNELVAIFVKSIMTARSNQRDSG